MSAFSLPMLLALLVLVITYILIFRETIHRASAAIMGAVLMVALGLLFDFYSQEQAILAIDINTLLVLIGMMVLVTLLKPTGGFEYIAVRMAKMAKGSPLRLLIYLSLAVSVISMFLDNVTTVIIFAPLTILICRMVYLNPLPYLMAEAMMSNIGGIATLIGDPPNLMIGSAAQIDFIDFFVHMAPIISVIWLVSMGLLIFLFYKQFNIQRNFGLLSMDEHAMIKQPRRLKKLSIIFAIVIILFFIHHHFHLYPSYVAMIGVAIALPLLNPNPQTLFGEISWSVLAFFAGLFVIVGGLEASGLLHLIGSQLQSMAQDPNQLLLVCLTLMWLAAIISAVIDNIPFTVTMIPIVQSLETQGINITPLWWALALGAGLGGNGTHIGATANIICINEAEKSGIHAARITPTLWLKKGMPMMFVSLSVASVVFVLFFGFFT